MTARIAVGAVATTLVDIERGQGRDERVDGACRERRAHSAIDSFRQLRAPGHDPATRGEFVFDPSKVSILERRALAQYGVARADPLDRRFAARRAPSRVRRTPRDCQGFGKILRNVAAWSAPNQLLLTSITIRVRRAAVVEPGLPSLLASLSEILTSLYAGSVVRIPRMWSCARVGSEMQRSVGYRPSRGLRSRVQLCCP